MDKIFDAWWIIPQEDYQKVCPVFKRTFKTEKPVKSAKLTVTALGVYEAVLNGKRVGEFFLAPGFTSYAKRLQYQEYDIKNMLNVSDGGCFAGNGNENVLYVYVGEGWCAGSIFGAINGHYYSDRTALLGIIEIEYNDGTKQGIITDDKWESARSPIQDSGLYRGETFDSRITPNDFKNVIRYPHRKSMLMPQEGEIVKEMEELEPIKLIRTPNGETVIDFGQNLAGYVSFEIKAGNGEILEYTHAEILDAAGNFYTENLRSAKQRITFICNGEWQSYKPHFSFQGFRYIRIDKFPESAKLDMKMFKAHAVYSEIKRTGHFECSDPMVNKLFSNVIWGQKSNFLDIPTDCPQRDERAGWTGDAQVFARTASYNFNVYRFFEKWLGDLAADQYHNGGVPHIIPHTSENHKFSAAWSDAAVICPYEMYRTYGRKEILKKQYKSMKKWIEYLREQGDSEYLWNDGNHYGDWCGLDSPPENCMGGTDHHLIAQAFFAHSTYLFIKVCKVLKREKKEIEDYQKLYDGVVNAFADYYIKDGILTSDTQTAYVLALRFDLVQGDLKRKFAGHLAELIVKNGNSLSTGFVGTPYLLHTLAENGYQELAYTLLLRREYPGWLYSVKMGATTIWEHWDGINEEGKMWSAGMNSFNHYAYGSVADWLYGAAAGINIDEEAPGFKNIIFKPVTDKRLDFVKASIETERGTVASEWSRESGQTGKPDNIMYTFKVPEGSTAEIIIDGTARHVGSGVHTFTGKG